MNPDRHAAIHQHGRLAGTLRASGTDSWAFTYAGGYTGPPVSLTLPVRACPITLAPVAAGETFSPAGLRSLHPRLTRLEPLALSQDEQLLQARLRADKMSIQGVQPKLSAVLKPGAGCFEVVDSGGRFILKPNPSPYAEVPANEALSMTLAKHAGIEVPPHGLLPAVDGSWVYVIRRFDRAGRDGRLHVEDFAQLSGATRDTKYASSLEQVAKVVETHCSFPAVENTALARRLLFCFLIGNEDMHLKNFSLLVANGTVRLAPAYDLLNTTLVLENASEESALPLRGRKRKLTRADWIRLLLPRTAETARGHPRRHFGGPARRPAALGAVHPPVIFVHPQAGPLP